MSYRPVPSGTGVDKIVSGVEQSPASLVVNADVDAAAAIDQSKIANLTTDLAGKVAGSIAATEVAFGTGPNAIGGDAGFTFNGGTLEVNAGGAYSVKAWGQVGINDVGTGEEVIEFEPSLYSFNVKTGPSIDPGPGFVTTVEAGQVTVVQNTDSTGASSMAGANLAPALLRLSEIVPGTQTPTIVTDDGAGNPIALDVVLDELRINGAAGSLGQVLTSQGTGSPPVWAASGSNPFGSKVRLVVEGGSYATLQAAVDASSANDIILVGAKAAGDWGNVTLNVTNKNLIIAALSGAGANKVVKVGSITYDLGMVGPVLNVNLNETYLYGLYIQGAFAGGSAVTLTGGSNYPGRLRLYGCYVLNTSATGTAAVTNSNSGANSSLYLDGCTVALDSSTTGSTIVQTAGYTVIRNRCDVTGSTAAGATGNAINVSAGTIEIFDSSVSQSRAVPVINITGATTYVSAGYSTVACRSDAAGAACAYVGTSGATFGAGDATLAAGTTLPTSAVAVAGVAGGTFAYSNVSFSYSPTASTVTATAFPQTGGLFSYGMSVGTLLGTTFVLNSTGNITKLNNVTTSFPSVQGSANQVLVNNGSGTLTWANGNQATLGSVGATPTAANLRTNATYTVAVAAVALPAMAAGDDGLVIRLVNISGSNSTVTPSTGVARTMSTGGGQQWVWRNTGTSWFCISNV